MKTAFILLSLLAFCVYADCSGTIEMELPAVSEGGELIGGSMVSVEMWLAPGEGGAYLGVVPPSDSTLQESVSSAFRAVEGLRGDDADCNILVQIDKGTDQVQGPSGGAAFALMMYALLEGEQMRTDAAITGGIFEDGSVLPVGGVYEKALSSKASGKEYLLTPLQSIDERLMLRRIEGITLYEVESLEEAADFFFNGIEPQEKSVNLTVEPLPELEEYAGNVSEEFGGIALGIIEREKIVVGGIADPEIQEYFGQRIAQQEELLEKKYYYPAANDAFLGYILADSLSRVDEPDAEGKAQEVEECLASVEEAEITYDNYEWVMGAQARIKRAENQLGKYAEDGWSTKEGEYYAVYQLDFALAWCDAAKEMYAIAKGEGGEPVDESVLKQSAEIFLNLSRNYTDIGESENYLNAMEMYEEGAYAGATYEFMYALSFEKSAQVEPSEAEVEALISGEKNTVWGAVFGAHSGYLLESGDPGGAYAVALFSYGMEELGEDMENYRVMGFFGEPVQEEDPCGQAICDCPECAEAPCALSYVLLGIPLLLVAVSKRGAVKVQ